MKLEIDFKDLKKFYDRIMVRKYKDMDDKFLARINGNPILYKVYIKDFGDFEAGFTVINSGDVEGEYYMTKGHRHKKAWNEMYILISGKGKLLIQGKETRVLDLKKDKIYNIPGTSGHRLINVGKTELRVLTIYSKDAGHDYKFGFKLNKKKNFGRKFFRF